MIKIYLAWLSLAGVTTDRLRFSVMIHESADVEAAEHYWAGLVGQDVAQFGKTTLKRHNPKTVRKNVGADYRGCLVVRVRQGADLYLASRAGGRASPSLFRPTRLVPTGRVRSDAAIPCGVTRQHPKFWSW